jgi:hypothetical protein
MMADCGSTGLSSVSIFMVTSLRWSARERALGLLVIQSQDARAVEGTCCPLPPPLSP